MEYSITTLWLGLMLVFFLAEALTFSIYLGFLGLGMLLAAAASYMGVGTMGTVAVAVIGSLALLFAAKAIKGAKGENSGELSLDVGARVHVLEVDPEGKGRVVYRGADWSAVAAKGMLTPGDWQIASIEGSVLVLEAVASATAS